MELIGNNCVRAPGKILLAGGYGILFSNVTGVCLCVNSSYYVQALPNDLHQVRIINQLTDDEPIVFGSEKTLSPFSTSFFKVVHKYLEHSNIQLQSLDLVIYFDEFFFGNTIGDQKSIYLNGKAFRKFSSALKDLSKTGLGSSATFIVGMVAAVLQYYFKNIDKRVLYIICLIINYYSQNKIGSGFDIFTSIFGHNLFQRIPENELQKLILLFEEENLQNYFEAEKQLLFDIKPHLFVIEKKIVVYLIDCNRCFSSPVSSSKMNLFLESHLEIKEEFLQHLNSISCEILSLFQKESTSKSKELNLRHRNLLQKISKKSGIDVEPLEYSILIDIIIYLFYQDIFYAICPGAGGYDAFVVLSEKELDFSFLRDLENPALLREVYKKARVFLEREEKYSNELFCGDFGEKEIYENLKIKRIYI